MKASAPPLSVKRAEECEDLADCLKGYRHQPDLTAHLDGLGSSQPLAQDVINEIVLWKVNRYAKLSPSALEALNGAADTEPRSHRTAKAALVTLLGESGVDLAMASTFLRFRNKKAFQIIDRHAYRAMYGKKYPFHPRSSVNDKIALYHDYLDRLFALADLQKVEFETLDRALYVFDKRDNGKL